MRRKLGGRDGQGKRFLCCLNWEEAGGKLGVRVPGHRGGTRRVGFGRGGSRRSDCRKMETRPHQNRSWEPEENTSLLSASSPAELPVSLCKVKAAGSASSGFLGNPDSISSARAKTAALPARAQAQSLLLSASSERS